MGYHPVKYLAIGPGGMGFYAMLGAIRNLDLTQVVEVSGSSAGSIIATFVALDKTVPEIMNMTLALDMKELTRLNLKSFISGFGIIAKSPIRDKLVEMCGSDPTFREMKKKLFVSAYCLEKGNTQYFSVDTDPDMKVLDAVCMSIAVPFLIEASRYKGCLYVDGGIIETVPMIPFIDKEVENTVAIQVISGGGTEKISTIFQFISKLVRTILRCIEYPNTHKVYLGGLNIFNFNLPFDNKLKMFLASKPCGRCKITVPVEKLAVESVSASEDTE
jgi:NTE family protein